MLATFLPFLHKTWTNLHTTCKKSPLPKTCIKHAQHLPRMCRFHFKKSCRHLSSSSEIPLASFPRLFHDFSATFSQLSKKSLKIIKKRKNTKKFTYCKKLAQNLHKLAQHLLYAQKLHKSCTKNCTKVAQTCTNMNNMNKLAQTCTNLPKSCKPPCTKLAQTCTNCMNFDISQNHKN